MPDGESLSAQAYMIGLHRPTVLQGPVRWDAEVPKSIIPFQPHFLRLFVDHHPQV